MSNPYPRVQYLTLVLDTLRARETLISGTLGNNAQCQPTFFVNQRNLLFGFWDINLVYVVHLFDSTK